MRNDAHADRTRSVGEKLVQIQRCRATVRTQCSSQIAPGSEWSRVKEKMHLSSRTHLVRISRFIFCGVILAVTAATSMSFAQSGTGSSEVTKSLDWMKTQQQPDGGFEVAHYPGFETPDAITALASAAQTGSTYSTSEAYTGVTSVVNNGKTPLDYADDLADETLTASTASKLITGVVSPLGLDAYDFDPSNDSIFVRDLVGAITSAQLPDGSYGAGLFNTTLTSVLALELTGNPISDQTITYIRSGQASDGSFNYAGEATLLDGGADTTALAIEALVAAGKDRNDIAIVNALTYLATTINSDGSFSNFGSPDPNSTATALRGLNATGINTDTQAWRDFYAPSRASLVYASPTSWLLSQQAPDGHIISPNDAYGINTFATSQTISALSGSWFPVRKLDAAVIVTTTSTASVPVVVQGTSLTQVVSPESSPSASGTLANTGSDAGDIAIVATVILMIGVCLLFFSKKKNK